MEEKILAILAELRPDIEVEKEEGLIADGLLESFDLIQLIALLENEFGIEIGSRNITMENFDSIDKIVKMVENLQR